MRIEPERKEVLVVVDLDTAIEMLSNAASSKRRQGARRLRQLGASSAGEALVTALTREFRDPRTWETQYQIIMAIGACGFDPALSLIRSELERPHVEMVQLALGDALLRLELIRGRTTRDFPRFLTSLIGPASEGVLRAAATLHLKLDEDVAAQTIEWVQTRGSESHVFWAAAACPGWTGPAVRDFLKVCLGNSSSETRRAADAALRGKYLRWRPL
jgi:hypothetical protein